LHITDLPKISLLVTCTAVVRLPLHQLGFLAQLATCFAFPSAKFMLRLAEFSELAKYTIL